MYVEFPRLLARIPEAARVLDLGGWDKVFPRANVVVDLSPYETRRNLNPEISERFTKDDWIIADFCSDRFWNNVGDKEFDFVTIGHTLEDIRDPLYVCSQMIRTCKAGYIEAPSKFRELSKLSASDTFSGYAHHRWVIEPKADLSGLIFKAKLAWAHNKDFLGDARRHMLSDYFHQFDGYFWNGSFSFIEYFSNGPRKEEADALWFFENYVIEGRQRNNVLDLVANSSSPDDGSCLWVTQYELPSKYEERTRQKPPTYLRYF